MFFTLLFCQLLYSLCLYPNVVSRSVWRESLWKWCMHQRYLWLWRNRNGRHIRSHWSEYFTCWCLFNSVYSSLSFHLYVSIFFIVLSLTPLYHSWFFIYISFVLFVNFHLIFQSLFHLLSMFNFVNFSIHFNVIDFAGFAFQ